MAQRKFDARIQWKRDTSANWTAQNPVLLNGEIIIVDTDSGETRFKIGDGTKTYTQLPFEDEAIRNLINGKTDERIYIGDTEPTNENVLVWINTSEEWSGTMIAQDRLVTVSMPASGWTGSTNPWSQPLTINGITTSSKLDLNPTAHQIVALQNEEITLMISNEDGVAVAYAIGGKPSIDMHMQVLISEVVVAS